MAYQSVNPATGEILKAFAEHSDEQMMSALALADKAFRTWAARPFSERSKIIGTSAQLLLKNKEELPPPRGGRVSKGLGFARMRGSENASALFFRPESSRF